MSRSARVLWALGRPLRWALMGTISLYRATLSGWLGGQCRFHPSCSQYALDVISTQGAVRGLGLATWRVLRCNPFGAGGLDPPPLRRPSGLEYEAVVPRVDDQATDDTPSPDPHPSGVQA